MSNRARVLVTRPEPGATETAARLEALGFRPLRLPLQETRSLSVDTDGLRGHYAAVAVPSASAIRHAPKLLIDRLSGLPCFAVGEATAQVARDAGFGQVFVADGDADSLAAEIIASKQAGPVVYLCGKVRRSIFKDELASAGIEVVTVETYDTLPIADAAARMSEILGGGIDYVLVYSAGAAHALAKAIRTHAPGIAFEKAAILCISARVADVAPKTLGGEIFVANKPSERALLELLQSRAKARS